MFKNKKKSLFNSISFNIIELTLFEQNILYLVFSYVFKYISYYLLTFNKNTLKDTFHYSFTLTT